MQKTMQNITHVYFLPGMSASSKIFERIHLPENKFKMHFLDWIAPSSKKESLEQYANRFSKLITEPNPVLVGVSFGGLLAQEITQIIPCEKIILISSAKSPNEYSPFFKFIKMTQLYKLYPISLINCIEPILVKYGSLKTKNLLISYRKFLPLRDKLYTNWAIQSFFNWRGCESNTPFLRLHGDKDKVIPYQYIKESKLIKNGTHAMIITKSNTIQQHIVQFLG